MIADPAFSASHVSGLTRSNSTRFRSAFGAESIDLPAAISLLSWSRRSPVISFDSIERGDQSVKFGEKLPRFGTIDVYRDVVFDNDDAEGIPGINCWRNCNRFWRDRPSNLRPTPLH